jgi:hypothetical protein
MGDFLPGLVVILDGHAFPPYLTIPRSGCQREPGWLIRGRFQNSRISPRLLNFKTPALHEDKSWKSCPRK